MERQEKIFLCIRKNARLGAVLCWFMALPLLLCGGCAATTEKSGSPAILLGGKPDFQHSRSFHKLVGQTAGTPEYEKGRIEYLLERISKSPYNFVRNGKVYTNAQAVAHLRWKHFRYQDEAQTAEMFINHIASVSRMSGKDYLIKVEDGRCYPLREILHRELKLLNRAHGEYQQIIIEQMTATQNVTQKMAKPSSPQGTKEQNVFVRVS